MPEMNPLAGWEGVMFEVSGDETISLAADGDPPFLHGVRVVFNDPWVRDGGEQLGDELEQRWRCPDATAVVRHVYDLDASGWTFRVQISNHADAAVTVPGCRLEFTSSWPARRWLAGAEGQISFDPERASGELLTLTQLRGRSRLSDGLNWLTDIPVPLDAAGTPGASYAVSWRADWLRDERVQAAALPVWWPADVVLDVQDEVHLDLPDAAIEGAGMQVHDVENGTSIRALPGIHLAQLHSGRGTTDIELAFSLPLWLVVSERAATVARRDPREHGPAHAFLLGRALGMGLLDANRRDEVEQVVEEVAARGGVVDPFTLAAVADRSLDDPAWAERLPDLLERLVEVPGAGLARLQSLVALQLAGLEPRLPAGRRVELDPISRALLALEDGLIRGQGAAAPGFGRVAGLLGAGLPGRTAEAEVRARAWAVLGLAPESVDLTDRWPRPLAVVREQARLRLLAEQVSDEVLAWLLW